MTSRLLPWTGWQEWDAVRLLLFADVLAADAQGTAVPDDRGAGAAARQLEGVARVKAWRCRSKLPLSLDITCALIEAQALDAAEAATTWLRCTAYALPIIRLVNGITDAQQRGRVASSVSVLSNAAGLPPLLVDVRHAATHGDLPSLAVLRVAAAQALSWLRASYWDSQAAHLAATHARVVEALAALAASWRAVVVATQRPAATGGAKKAAVGRGGGTAGKGGPASPADTADTEQQAERRALLAEVSALLPASWSAALAHPVLTTWGPGLPHPLTGLPVGLVGSPQQTTEPARKKRKRPATEAARTVDSDVARHCLAQLLKVYQALGPHMAACCVASLAYVRNDAKARDALLWWPAPLLGTVDSREAALPADLAFAWLQLLLPAPGDTSLTPSLLVLSPQQVQELLTWALRGLGGCAQEERRAALEWVARRLAALLPQQGCSKEAAQLLRLAQLLPEAAGRVTRRRVVPQPGGPKAVIRAASELRALLEAAGQRAAPRDAQPRWRRAAAWQQPCAMGCLPSACIASGLVPQLLLQPPAPEPESFAVQGGEQEAVTACQQTTAEVMPVAVAVEDAQDADADQHQQHSPWSEVLIRGVEPAEAEDWVEGGHASKSWRGLSHEQLHAASNAVRFL